MKRKSIQRNSAQIEQESDSLEKIREFVQGRGSVILSVLLGALALFAYLLRPVLLKNHEEPVNLYAMQQFCWYVTIPAMILLFYGFYRILHRNQEWEKYLLFLTIGFSNLIAYITQMDFCLHSVCADDGGIWDQPVAAKQTGTQRKFCDTGWTCSSYHRNAFDPECSIFNGKNV